MNDNGFSDDICRSEFIREKIHSCIAVIGKKDRKVASMVAVGLMGRVPMPVC